MSERPFSVCVFCASSEAVSAEHRAVAAALGRAIAERGWRVVYGGGGIGLMGEVARGALAADGQVLGVIPHRLATREVALPEVTELVRTDTMRERKHRMDLESDAFIVLPGGIGTLEELVEILTLKQLGYHDRAIVLIDPEGFWDPLFDLLARMVEERLAHAHMPGLLLRVDGVPAAVDALRRYRPPAPRPIAPVREALEAAPAD
jgi:uncharacterized protein (TIGR00730 family)